MSSPNGNSNCNERWQSHAQPTEAQYFAEAVAHMAKAEQFALIATVNQTMNKLLSRSSCAPPPPTPPLPPPPSAPVAAPAAAHADSESGRLTDVQQKSVAANASANTQSTIDLQPANQLGEEHSRQQTHVLQEEQQPLSARLANQPPRRRAALKAQQTWKTRKPMPKRDTDAETEKEPESETEASEKKRPKRRVFFWSFKEERLLDRLVQDAMQLNGKQFGSESFDKEERLWVQVSEHLNRTFGRQRSADAVSRHWKQMQICSIAPNDDVDNDDDTDADSDSDSEGNDSNESTPKLKPTAELVNVNASASNASPPPSPQERPSVKYHWSDEEQKRLLELITKAEQQNRLKLGCSLASKDIWESLAIQLNLDFRTNRSPCACYNRWYKLKKMGSGRDDEDEEQPEGESSAELEAGTSGPDGNASLDKRPPTGRSVTNRVKTASASTSVSAPSPASEEYESDGDETDGSEPLIEENDSRVPLADSECEMVDITDLSTVAIFE